MNVARTAPAGRRRALAVVLRALLATALLTTTAVVATATPAAASPEDPVANLWWVRCQDESEPFSDEPYILLNGQQIASGNNIDPGKKFYFFGNSEQHFNGEAVLVLELWEDDGIWGDDHLGNFYVYASYLGAGEVESYVFGNGEYILHYTVT